MQLKVGGVYKARNGERVEIVGSDGHCSHPFYASDGGCRMTDGRKYSLREGEHDLIAEWQDEPAPEVGQWIGWNGGECPVHPETVVDKITKGRHDYSELAGELDWSTGGAYRIITPYVEPPKPREFWVLHGVDGMKDCVSDTPIKSPLAIHVREVMPDDE